jgi:hypothetical protein
MITTTTFDSIHLRAFELHSAQCASVQTVFLTDELWDVVGVVCDVCRTHLWLDNRRHPILGRARPDFPSREAYLAWNAETDREFFASLPRCPACRSGRFTRYVTNVPDPQPTCADTGRPITDARWVNVSDRYAGTAVYWYQEDSVAAA